MRRWLGGCWRRQWPWLLGVGVLYATGVVWGIGLGAHWPALASSPTQSGSTAGGYISHNLAVLALEVSGLVTFGLTTIGMLFVNGAELGAALARAAVLPGFGRFLVILARHGFVEVAGTLLGATAGMQTLNLLAAALAGKPVEWRARLLDALAMTVIAAAFIGVAGVLEAL